MGGFCISPHKRGCHAALGRREWAFWDASGLQDLTVKGILMSKWAWRSGVCVMLWISSYLFRGRYERKTFRSSLFRIVVQGAEGREG